MANRNYVLWGSAGHAKVLADIISKQGDQIAALVDNDRNVGAIAGDLPIFHSKGQLLAWLEDKDARQFHGLVAIGGGRGRDRMELHALFRDLGFCTEALVDGAAHVSPQARIGLGSQLLPYSLVAADSAVGEACILNHKSSLDHESTLGSGVHLAPGATVCGAVRIGDNVFVGAGACVLPRVSIGNDTIIGAGSLVTQDLPGGVIAYGHPARVIRENN